MMDYPTALLHERALSLLNPFEFFPPQDPEDQRSLQLAWRHFWRGEYENCLECIPVRQISCGCCTNGCCCFHHQDTPNGRPPHKCEWHQ